MITQPIKQLCFRLFFIVFMTMISEHALSMTEKAINSHTYSFGNLYALAHDSDTIGKRFHSRMAPHFFHIFKTNVETNAQQQTVEKSFLEIISDVEYEIYLDRIYENKDIKTLKNELPYEFAQFKQRGKTAHILAQADVLREEARTRKLGNGSLFKGRIYRELGITRRLNN